MISLGLFTKKIEEVEKEEEVLALPSHFKLTDLLEPGSELRTLGEEAKSILGYARIENMARLKDALVKLEIEPLRISEVHAYQQKLSAKEGKEWQWTAIEKYTEPIPEFVLRKAIQLKKEIPDVTFSVVHLGEVDPFLFAAVGNRGYWIEVWDEPEFESDLL